MTSQNKQVAQGQQATFRGRMVSITVLELYSTDLDELDGELRAKMAQAPEFFRNAPLLLDCSQLEDGADSWWLDRARRLMINNYFAPVGITGASEVLEYAAKTLDIAVWPTTGSVRISTEERQESETPSGAVEQEEPAIPNEPFVSQEEPAKPSEPFVPQEEPAIVSEPFIPDEEPAVPNRAFSLPGQGIEPEPAVSQMPPSSQEPVPTPEPMREPESAIVQEVVPPVTMENQAQQQAYAETMVVTQPIRSGQKVYAQGGDLLVLSSVSTGAEILADGHIHVYGTLRGRAIAGAQGNENARIFCNDLQADLIAIAGFYTISDDIPEDKQKKAVQIFLRKEQLLIEPL